MGWSGEQLLGAPALCPRLGEKVILGLSSVPGWKIQMNQLRGDLLLGLSWPCFQKWMVCQPQYMKTEALKNSKLLTMSGSVTAGGFLAPNLKANSLSKHRDDKQKKRTSGSGWPCWHGRCAGGSAGTG